MSLKTFLAWPALTRRTINYWQLLCLMEQAKRLKLLTVKKKAKQQPTPNLHTFLV